MKMKANTTRTYRFYSTLHQTAYLLAEVIGNSILIGVYDVPIKVAKLGRHNLEIIPVPPQP